MAARAIVPIFRILLSDESPRARRVAPIAMGRLWPCRRCWAFVFTTVHSRQFSYICRLEINHKKILVSMAAAARKHRGGDLEPHGHQPYCSLAPAGRTFRLGAWGRSSARRLTLPVTVASLRFP